MPTLYSPSQITNFFLERANEAGSTDFTPMKAQKLVYFAHGWHLGHTDKPLIDEQVECWPYGPVVSSLFHRLKAFGSSSIRFPITDVQTVRGAPTLICPSVPTDDPNRSFLADVWRIYGGYTPAQLSNMTHLSGTPWRKVYDQYGGSPPKHTDIPQEVIRDYFKNLIRLSSKAASHG